MESVQEDIIAGKNITEVAKANPSAFIKYSSGIQRYYDVMRNIPRDGTWRTKGYWAYGPTGSGKSRWANRIGGSSVYFKDPQTEWFCGFDGEETVIVDDYRSNARLNFNFLLRMCDWNQLPVQVKGGRRQFNAKRVIVTSPVNIEACFAHLEGFEGSLAQLKRRFVELEFGEGKLSHHLELNEIED